MPGLERNADLAVGLESADARAMPGARIDDDERPARRIDFDASWRDDSHQSVVDRPSKRSAVDEKLHLVVEHVRSGLSQMLAILIAALAHDIPEQHAALRGIDHVFHGWGKYAERRCKCADRRWMRLAQWHCSCSCLLSAAARRARRTATRLFVHDGAPRNSCQNLTALLPGHADEPGGRFTPEAIHPMRDRSALISVKYRALPAASSVLPP
jgi:hypothetical protein